MNLMMHVGQSAPVSKTEHSKFGTFAVGTSNKEAFHLAQQCVKGEGSNVLFLHAPFGIGKTHLLNTLTREAPQKRVVYLGAEHLMRRSIETLRNRNITELKEEIDRADVVLIDDLQHLCGYSIDVNGFLRFVRTRNRIVIVGAEVVPGELPGLAEDVRSSFVGGLTIPLTKPDTETRFAILEAKMAEMVARRPRSAISPDMLKLIAARVDETPREFLGVLARVATLTDLSGKAPTPEVVEQAIEIGKGVAQRLTIDDIQEKVRTYYKLEPGAMQIPSRARRVARPRQVAMRLCRDLTSRSFPSIGKDFGGRDHTTILHGCRRIDSLCEADPLFKNEVDFLRKVLSPRRAA